MNEMESPEHADNLASAGEPETGGGAAERAREEFVRELSALREEVTAKLRLRARINLPEFHPEEIAAAERELWEKYKNGTLTEEEFHRYNGEFRKELTQARAEGKEQELRSRQLFLNYLANKAMPMFLARDREQKE